VGTGRTLGCWLAAVSVIVGACGGSTATSAPSSNVPVATTPPPVLPTDAPTTVSPSPSSGDSPTATSTLPPDVCTFTAPVADGEITWIDAGRLQAFEADGSTRCLLDGVTPQSGMRWSATGERVLLDPATIEGADGSRASGFAAANQTVSWSAPEGKAIISIDAATHHLIWHSSTSNNTQDISFLARTDEAVYHPAGKGIAAVGLAEDGEYGIWLASNRGENRRLITRIDDPNTPPTDLAFSADGLSLQFIHRAAHRLMLQGLILEEVGVEGRQEDNLTVSTVESVDAYTTGPCDGTGSIIANGTDLRTAAGSPFAGGTTTLRPVGWLNNLRLVIAARAVGCDGPADVWIWSSPTNTFEPVGANVSSIAVRIPHGPFQELPANIDQAAPG
jgi:hypothetical protein